MNEHETLLRLQYMYDSNNPFMVGRRIEIENAMKAIKIIEKIKFIINEKHYPEAEECDYGKYYECENALMIKDIEILLNS